MYKVIEVRRYNVVAIDDDYNVIESNLEYLHEAQKFANIANKVEKLTERAVRVAQIKEQNHAKDNENPSNS